ncbi:Bacteriophage/Gene transfer agent portal protein [uncultured Caudovirales phage]|uniref:Bacteriophage/Gene transfer agent portal protein n=1 Tax=uncultured Caudovirales phage TaxID=2100421 RepID=A0A6J5PZP6_9CAUD|nr:Bacteriophage/Gene transfer agent portal protein [uncultured Caudovirales phage]CAB4171482.1 Bacteriophage/Gene transfer agent portal protein [uncultured Caudovirales phage]CAB4177289.1 Bacteriophage/Gene transfer agent portal protein [uncultured Caudovirales phage]CAB4199570.1 Bacteriophage/Gene transfer agent portal protein [uncultured Caudovirales phage]CAB4213567.1 Bacteriophage/Gene transfer agent portal protein [uncultured Caudovirales phage]
MAQEPIFYNLGTFGMGGRFTRALQISGQNIWNNQMLSPRVPVFIDMNNLFDVYSNCPPLQMVISKKAEMVSNGKLKLRKKSDPETEIDKHWALDLMKNPNPLQPFREWLYEFNLYFSIYANNFIYAAKPFKNSKPRIIWNLPSGNMKIIPTGKWLDQDQLSGIIDKYELWGINEVSRTFTTDEVKHINSGLSKSIVKADSKMIGLTMPISNAISAYKTRNCLINENAGITIISSAAGRDGDGAVPYNPTEQERFNDDFKNTNGLIDSQSRKIFSKSPVTITPLSFPTQQMLLFEEVEDALQEICGTYGMDRNVLPSTKGGTYENTKQGIIETYNGVVRTEASSICNFLDTLLLGDEDAEFYLSYDHISVLREDELKEAQEDKLEVETLSIMYRDGIISKEQYAELAEVEADGTGIPVSNNFNQNQNSGNQ